MQFIGFKTPNSEEKKDFIKQHDIVSLVDW